MRNRQTGSHGLNEFSSRSHSVLTVTIDSETQPDSEDDNLYVTKRGKLSFVDLAGQWGDRACSYVEGVGGSVCMAGGLGSGCVNERERVCVRVCACVCVCVVMTMNERICRSL